MRFALSDEQRQFGAAVHDLLADIGVPAAARAWAAGDHGPGLSIWQELAKTGVTALAVPESCGGAGAGPVDLVVACEELGHHPLPGSIAESVAAVPALLAALPSNEQIKEWLAGLACGELIATLAMPPKLPYALDADIAGLILMTDGGTLWQGTPRARLESVDPARRLFEVWPARALSTETGAILAASISSATDNGTLANAALLLGAGRGLLESATLHAKTREQFGKPIGAFQAVKHALADVLIGLEFARPLLYGAAVALGGGAATTARDISAARVACAEAARRAARVALQVHGAIGYTQECDISLWLAKVPALSATWGSQAEHRAVVLAALADARTGAWR